MPLDIRTTRRNDHKDTTQEPWRLAATSATAQTRFTPWTIDRRRRFKGHCCNIVSEVEELVGDMADCLPRTQHQAKLKVLRPRTATPKLIVVSR